MQLRVLLCAVVLFKSVISVPLGSKTESLVTRSETTGQVNIQADERILKPPKLDYMHVFSNVNNRYAHTIISTRYKNQEDVSQEATFSIVLPETAFITEFLMHIENKTYEAYVKGKEEAKAEYDAAVSQGLSAAYVAVNARDSNRFTVSVNIEPYSKVIFNLTYEELLVRKHGKYEMVVNLHPGQLVTDLSVDVNIHESRPLINLYTPAIRTGNDINKVNSKNNYAEIKTVGDDNKEVNIHFTPTVQQQKEMAKTLGKESDIFAGQFVVEYDVERDSKGGEVLVSDGYFVHFFAPKDLEPLPKYVVFVLDVSSSMYGRRILQLREAMEAILKQLNPEDYFNLIEFNSHIKLWNLENLDESPTLMRNYYFYEENIEQKPFELLSAYPATKENLEIAQNIVRNMTATGGTNIYDALQIALNMTAVSAPVKEKDKVQPQPMIIFLTDGEATVGKTSTKDILQMVSDTNADKSTTIFSLAFGSGTDKQLLKSLSLKNNGFMRQIYEASDAALQLQDFYRQIASPLLANVAFTYPEGESEAITKHVFHTLFSGGEFVIAGKMNETAVETAVGVHGLGCFGPIDFTPTIIPRPHKLGSLERLWAYATIRQLLDKTDELENDEDKGEEKKEIKKKALDLALKYSFVTPVTSLVVVKPNETQKVDTEEAASNNNPGWHRPSYGSVPISARTGGAFYNRPMASYSPIPSKLFSRPIISPTFSLTTAGRRTAQLDSFLSPLDVNSDLSSIITSPGISMTDSPSSSSENATNFEPTWMSVDHITINGTVYKIGDNNTMVDSSSCIVENITGHCTIFSACPQLHITFEKYQESYFCPLTGTTDNIQYAGICCRNDVTESIETKEK